jgi:CRP/FNR family cyclic AMP-dependent transcriptional regulator
MGRRLSPALLDSAVVVSCVLLLMSTLDPRIEALANPAVRLLAAQGEVRSYPRNAILVNEEEAADTVYVVLTGRVRVYVSDADGHEMVLGLCAAGDLLGEMSLDGGTRSASAITVEPCTCAVVTRAQLRTAIEQDPEVAFHLLTVLIHRARMAIGNVKGLALLDAYGRIVQALNRMAQRRDGVLVVSEGLTQQEFGERAGTSRDMVNRIFRDLTAGGYITVKDDRSIVIHRKPPSRW